MIQDYNFGIEIEMTGLTRAEAAEVVAGYFGTTPEHIGGAYDKYGVHDMQGRLWQFASDASIQTYRKAYGNILPVNDRAY